MKGIRTKISACVLAIALAGTCLAQKTKPPQPKPITIEMEQKSIFDHGGLNARSFARGKYANTSSSHEKNVKYPKFNSAQPIYGMVCFNNKVHYFALDKSDAAIKDYDLFYFDANGDKDFTNDKVLKLLKNPPKSSLAR